MSAGNSWISALPGSLELDFVGAGGADEDFVVDVLEQGGESRRQTP